MNLFNHTLHLLIEIGDCNTIKKFLENNPSDDCYLLNDKFESAIKTAIVHKRFDIYDLLKSKKMCLGQHEQMEDVTRGLSDSEKRTLSSINKKYFRNANVKPKHIEILISKTQLGHDGDIENEPKFKELYCAAFEDLNEIPFIENILKIASTSEKLCIVFDFHRESVEQMNPTKNKSVSGSTCLADNYIYIGARNLQDPQTRWMVLGTIAHELCHLALKIVYNNSCKPYASGDVEREKEFQLIVELCKKSQDKENLIELAFQAYDSNKWHAELIVRVPHILAKYFEDSCKVSRARHNFSALFTFFEKYALNAFIKEYSEFETRENIKEVNRELNFDAEFLRSSLYDDLSFSPEVLNLNLEAKDKIIHMPTKFRHLTIKAISQQIRKENFESSYIFANLKYLEDPSKSNRIDAVFELIPKPTIILDCNEITAAKDLLSLALKFKERVILVTNDNCKLETNHSKIEKRDFELGWEDLSNECKDKLLNQQVKFQGKSVKLFTIVKKTYLETLETAFFKKIIEKSDVKIGSDIVGLASYIERKFLGIDPTDKTYSDDLIFEYDVCDIHASIFSKKRQRIILLCDEPGMGKSTELKMLAVKLKTDFPHRWIVFMDLKLFFKCYEKDGSTFLYPRNSGDIIKFFCEKILNLDDLETKVFYYQFMNHLVIFLIDGLDEICPAYKQFIFHLIKTIGKRSENQIWISTRPHLKSEFKIWFDTFELRLKPFDYEDQKLFFKNLLISEGVADDILDRKLKELETLSKSFQKFSPYRSDFNPLLMTIVAENVISENGTAQGNLFNIYEQYTGKMLSFFLLKGHAVVESFAQCLLTPKSVILLKYHFKLALEITLEHPELEILEHCYPVSSDWNPAPDDKLRVGLLYSNGFDYQFIHRNFAEFYVAKLIHDNFNSCNGVKKLLLEILREDDKCKMIRIFLDHAFENLIQNFQRIVSTKITYGLEMMNCNQSFEILLLMINNSCLNLIKFHFMSLKCDDVFNVSVTNQIDEIILSAAKSDSVYFIKNFFVFIKPKINATEILHKFFLNPSTRANIYKAALENSNPEVFIYFLRNGLPFKDEFLAHHLLGAHILQDSLRKRDDIETLLIIYMKQLKNKQLINLLTPQLPELICNKNVKSETLRFLLETLKNAYGPNVLVKLLQRKFTASPNANLFMHAVSSNNLEKIKEFWRYFCENCDNEDTKRAILLQTNEFCETAFQYAFNSQSTDIFKFIKDLYFHHLRVDEIRQIVFSKIDKNETNILLNAFLNNYKQKMVLELCECFRFLFSGVTGSIELSEENELSSVFEFIHPQNKFSLFMYVALTYGRSECETVVNLVREIFQNSIKIKILLQKSDSGETAFQFALTNKDGGTFECIRNFYDEVLGTQGVKEIALLNVKGENILRYALNIVSESGNVWFFTELCQYLRFVFKDSRPNVAINHKLFFWSDKNGLTFLKLVAYYHSKEVVEALWQLINQLCDAQTMRLMLEKHSVLFYAFKNKNPEVFYYVRSVYCQIFYGGVESLVNTSDQYFISNAVYTGLESETILILLGFLQSKITKTVDKKLFNFFRTKKKYGVSLVMYVAFYYNKMVFKALWNVIEKTTNETMRREILTQKSDFGETVYQLALKNRFRDTSKFIIKIYTKMAIALE